jgi:hypothetical protein
MFWVSRRARLVADGDKRKNPVTSGPRKASVEMIVSVPLANRLKTNGDLIDGSQKAAIKMRTR